MKFDLYLNDEYVNTFDKLDEALTELEQNKNSFKYGDYIRIDFDKFTLLITHPINYEYILYLAIKGEQDAFAKTSTGNKELKNTIHDIINYKSWSYHFGY